MSKSVHVSGKLYRGSRPKSFADLVDLGVTDVINLQSGVHELLNEDGYEHEEASAFGMVEHDLNCSDVLPPRMWQVWKFLDILKNAKGYVYVHCLHGKDRTGFMCAVWRMQQDDWNFIEAKEEMFSMGFHKFPYLWWLFALKDYEK